MTEGRNTGFKKILDALDANGSPKPEFVTDEARSYFMSRFYIHEGFLNVSEKEPKKEPKKSQKGAEKRMERKQALVEKLKNRHL